MTEKCLQLGAKKVFYIPADMISPAEPERVMQFAVQKMGRYWSVRRKATDAGEEEPAGWGLSESDPRDPTQLRAEHCPHGGCVGKEVTRGQRCSEKLTAVIPTKLPLLCGSL